MKISILAIALALGLAACDFSTPSQTDKANATTEATSPSPDATTAAARDTDVAGASDAGGMNTPLSADAVDLRLALSGVPHYDAARDLLLFEVQVTNGGPTAITSKGSKPVRLGLMLAGPAGVDKPPGNRNFKRVDLPFVAAGERVVVPVAAPVQPLLGMRLEIDGLQEGVAWFGRRYGKPVLNVGTFKRCGQGGHTLCNRGGQPVSPL